MKQFNFRLLFAALLFGECAPAAAIIPKTNLRLSPKVANCPAGSFFHAACNSNVESIANCPLSCLFFPLLSTESANSLPRLLLFLLPPFLPSLNCVTRRSWPCHCLLPHCWAPSASARKCSMAALIVAIATCLLSACSSPSGRLQQSLSI